MPLWQHIPVSTAVFLDALAAVSTLLLKNSAWLAVPATTSWEIPERV